MKKKIKKSDTQEIPQNVINAEKVKALTTRQKKKRFISAYGSRLCNVAATCEVVGISRNTFYRWCDEDDLFKKQINIELEKFKDTLETTMYSKAVVDKDTTMLIWLSKTKMKDRGYVEKVEQEVTVNPFLKLMQEATSSEENK